MTPLLFATIVFGLSISAGFLGAILGLGGGFLLVPALTLLLQVDLRLAAGASLVSVIATSSGAATAYAREGLANPRVGLFLSLGTASGAITGSFLAGVAPTRWLFVLFGVVVGGSAALMLHRHLNGAARTLPPDPVADRLELHGACWDDGRAAMVPYRVARSRLGLGLMYVAGIVSGLLGVGSGPLKVASLDLAMGLPIKASTATSNFMMGITAAASAGVYLARGDLDPFLVGPVCAGVLLGAFVGARTLGRLQGRLVRSVFIVVLLGISVQMILRGLR